MFNIHHLYFGNASASKIKTHPTFHYADEQINAVLRTGRASKVEEVLYKPQRQPRHHDQPDLHTAPGLKLATVRDLHLSS